MASMTGKYYFAGATYGLGRKLFQFREKTPRVTVEQKLVKLSDNQYSWKSIDRPMLITEMIGVSMCHSLIVATILPYYIVNDIVHAEAMLRDIEIKPKFTSAADEPVWHLVSHIFN